MRRPVARLLIAACVVVGGACASVNTAGSGADTRTYATPIDTVIEAAAVAFEEAGFEVEQRAWVNDSTYAIVGTMKSTFVRSHGQPVQVASITVTIKKVSDQETAVRLATSQRDTPAMASSADRRNDDARRFFSRLDAKLG